MFCFVSALDLTQCGGSDAISLNPILCFREKRRTVEYFYYFLHLTCYALKSGHHVESIFFNVLMAPHKEMCIKMKSKVK